MSLWLHLIHVNKGDTAVHRDRVTVCNCMKMVVYFKSPQPFFGFASFGSNDMKVKTNVEWIECLYLFTQPWYMTRMYFICIMCVCAVGCVVLGVCVCVRTSFLPESWSCFPGHPQRAPQGSSCQLSGTSPEHELSPMNGSPGPPPPLAYGTHTHTHTRTYTTSLTGLLLTNHLL